MKQEDDLGFQFDEQKSGLVIYHHGRLATRFSGKRATQISAKLSGLDEAGQQQLMARLTGNYKRGNERPAKRH